MAFCDYLKEIDMKCAPCFENLLGACHVKLGSQEYYPKEFALYDSIQIIRHGGHLAVETDIEVLYNTEYPYGSQAGKGAEFANEYTKNEKTMRDYLTDKLPSGAKLLRSHQHYNPDKHDPNIVAIHIHAYKTVEDLDEAKLVATKLADTIKPKEIASILLL